MMSPEKAAVAETTLALRLSGGLYALSRLLTTLLGKRVPVQRLSVASEGEDLRVALDVDCPPEQAKRFSALLSGLEDVREVRPAERPLEIAVVHASGGTAHSGVELCEPGESVVASGGSQDVERWLSEAEYSGEAIRLGPIARPGKGD
jgi:hypothetical protein